MTVYIDSGTTIFKVSNCVLDSVTFGLEKNMPLTVSVVGTGEKREVINNLPSFSSMVYPGAYSTGTLVATKDAVQVPNLAGVTFEVVTAGNSGQVNYTSNNLPGTGYSGIIHYNIKKFDFGGSVTWTHARIKEDYNVKKSVEQYKDLICQLQSKK